MTDTFDVLDRASDSTVICAGMTHLLRFYKEFPYGPYESPESILYVGGLQGLAEAKEENSRYHIGSTRRIREVEEDPFLFRFAPALSEAARHTSTPQIRNMRTLGGELAWGSLHSPLITALMVYDAEVKIRKPIDRDGMAKEESYLLENFYHDTLERKNSSGQKLQCRRAQLRPRDLMLKACIPADHLRRSGSFSFFQALTPKISTENSGVVLAIRGVVKNGVLMQAQFVASGLWLWTIKETIPLETCSLKPDVLFEKLYNFVDRLPIESYRRAGPRPKQLSLILFGLMKKGFSGYFGFS